MSRGLIISATDTNVGKTVFSAALVSALNATYWKPIQAGLRDETDMEVVARLSNAQPHHLLPEAYRLTTPCSPHRAAQIDNIEINPEKLSLPTIEQSSDHPLIIEGAGGLLTPLTRDYLQIDQFKAWALPIVLCARTALGTINHTLLSVEAIKSRHLPFLGIVFIGDENTDTQRTIEHLTGTTILGRLPLIATLDHASLQTAFTNHFRTQDFNATP